MKASIGRFAVVLIVIGVVSSPLQRAAAQVELGTQPNAARPNILLILVDDLGAECLGAYGGTSYRTPNLDALAGTGLRFANCYATPLCSPSRVQLMTGRYGFRTGWTNLIDRGTPEFLNPAEFNFAHLLKTAGYRTAVAGKWQLAAFQAHPNHVNECGFDEYLCWAWKLDGIRTSRYWWPVLWENGVPRTGTSAEYGEDLFCNFLIDFMARNRTNAFFAYYPMVLVHEPFKRTPDGSSAAVTPMRRFRDMVAYMDKTVGRLVGALDELGLRENTLILFTADNGTPGDFVSYTKGLAIRGGKGTVTHVGSHVPLIASWKDTINQPGVVHALVDFSDILPTLADVSRAQIPAGLQMDGRSFAPHLLGTPTTAREWIFVQLGSRKFVRGAKWLLHHDGRVYDIRRDPLELNNRQGQLGPVAALEVKKLRNVMKQLKVAAPN